MKGLSIGFIALAIYLILVGLRGVFDIGLGPLRIVEPIMALIAGIFILVRR